MHRSSLQNLERLIERYLADVDDGQVLDVGAMGLNGAYRPLFDQKRWSYFGLDLTTGPNVDIVAEDPYHWPIESSRFDVVVSGQAFEHIEFFWLTILEIRRVLKPGGVAFIVAPSRGPQHKNPVDCWRFYPDSHAALAKWSGLNLLEVNNPWLLADDLDFDSMWEWGDCVGAFRRPECQPDNLGDSLQAAAKSHIRTLSNLALQTDYPGARIPKSRHSYLSLWSSLKFRFRKHFLR